MPVFVRAALFACLLLIAATPAVRSAPVPAWLPRYDLDIRLDPVKRVAQVRQRVTFTNRHERPATDLTFNAHGRYEIPDDEAGFLAKMAEILRTSPKESMTFDGPALDLTDVAIVDDPKALQQAAHPRTRAARKLDFRYGEKNKCSFTIPLPHPVGPGESVTVDLAFTFKIPAKKGRWGQWNDITTLAQWLPTLAVYDEEGWHALPFIPWHQPFYNEAGVYTVQVTLPAGQMLGCSPRVKNERTLEDGWIEYELETSVLRDFSLTCSARYRVTECKAGTVAIRCLHLPEHEHYAKIFTQTACEALPIYEKWFGPYPYPQFVIAEACFGWNGNECGGMVLIDDRMFNFPHIAKNYPIYLLQHELCHQWWYNVVGTNGYSETFMDEAMAAYFSHRLADQTLGKNNPVLEYPKGFGWMPNIHRDDLRFYGIVGARARGEIHPTVQPIEKFGHLPNLLAYTYDRGSKIIGQIEARLGETAFMDFTRVLYRKYTFQILRVADFQRELEAYTGKSWEEFFRHWVHGTGMCDWKIDRVEVDGCHGPRALCKRSKKPVQVVIDLLEQEGYPEPTVLGIQLSGDEGISIRLPIDPSVPLIELVDEKARIETRVLEPDRDGKRKVAVKITITAPCSVKQIVIDPDRVLIDARPDNNAWIAHAKIRLTPMYTMLDELDVAVAYDRLNIIAGPWIGTASTVDPFYQRSPLFGGKVGFVRTQEFTAGVYSGYRTNDRNVVVGADFVWDHIIVPPLQIGFNIEQSLIQYGGNPAMSQGVLYSRYILTSGSSLFMPHFEYFETFGLVQSHPFRPMRDPPPGADPFNQRTSVGMHYHKNMLTPYWDAEGGIALDLYAQYGIPIFGLESTYQQVQGQISTVENIPEMITNLSDGPIMSWLKETRFAFRAGGGAALPTRGQFFSLGGGDQFRGYDIRERQGSLLWLLSAEWRLPIWQHCTYDLCDHVAGIRNVYLAPFYDVGQAYVNNHPIGQVAHAVGVGLRVDVQWLGIIERTILRLDVAKTINDNTPMQFWLGIQHPF